MVVRHCSSTVHIRRRSNTFNGEVVDTQSDLLFLQKLGGDEGRYYRPIRKGTTAIFRSIDTERSSVVENLAIYR